MDVFLTRHGARIDKEDRQETMQNSKEELIVSEQILRICASEHLF